MAELIKLVQDLSPFAAFVLVALVYLRGRGKENDTNLKIAELQATTAKYNAEAETRRDIERAKVAADLIVQREKIAAELETSRRETSLVLTKAVITLDAIAGRQVETTGAVMTSEQTVKQAVTSSEGRVVAAVAASKDDVIRVVRLLGKVNTDVFQPVASEPPDLAAMQIILEDTITAIETAKRRMQNAPVRVTSEVPVVITDVSPSAVETIVSAVVGNGDSEGKKIA